LRDPGRRARGAPARFRGRADALGSQAVEKRSEQGQVGAEERTCTSSTESTGGAKLARAVVFQQPASGRVLTLGDLCFAELNRAGGCGQLAVNWQTKDSLDEEKRVT